MPCRPVRETEFGYLGAADPADRTQDRVELGQQLVQAGGVDARAAEFELGAQAADQIHLGGHHLRRQHVGGKLVEQAAAGRLALVEHACNRGPAAAGARRRRGPSARRR